MSLRPSPWPLFGGGTRRDAHIDPDSPGRPDLKLVEGGHQPRLERLTARARIVSLVVMVGLVLFGVVAFHVVLSQGQFKLEKMEARADTAQSSYERLRLQVAQLESPARITSEAQNRLGMVPPDKVTAVAPGANDMPQGTSAGSAQTSVGPTSPPDTADAGDWTKVKPQLQSTAK